MSRLSGPIAILLAFACAAVASPPPIWMHHDDGTPYQPVYRQNEKDGWGVKLTPAQASTELTRFGADVIGANCGNGIEDYIPICASLAASTTLPIWIKPNAGLPELIDGKVVYTTTPDQFAGNLHKLLEAGANFVGGCCGTSPEFIAALRTRLAG